MENRIKQLIDYYKGRIQAATEIIELYSNEEDKKRLRTKIQCYSIFIRELKDLI